MTLDTGGSKPLPVVVVVGVGMVGVGVGVGEVSEVLVGNRGTVGWLTEDFF